MACAALAQAPQPDAGGVRPGTLPRRWLTGGPNCMEVPDWQVHEYNSDLYILRESGCTNYEKPFLYLIFGQSKVMLMDTGAGKTDVAREIDGVISKWLQRNRRDSIPLIVAHSHSHSDHVAGDSQFRDRPGTTLVPLTVEATQRFFAIDRWPDGMGQIDLGGRVVDVLPIPGHNKLSLAYYDRQTGILFTGDTVYPGRLYVEDFPAFVTHLLGCHIEQTATPYLDYPIGSMYQPDEHPLELGRGELLELDALLRGMDKPRRIAARDFTVWPADAKGWQELEAIEKVTLEKQRQSMWGQPR
jgi:hydroxyacylglutathione hydrolase